MTMEEKDQKMVSAEFLWRTYTVCLKNRVPALNKLIIRWERDNWEQK